jgi:hypothetical protein
MKNCLAGQTDFLFHLHNKVYSQTMQQKYVKKKARLFVVVETGYTHCQLTKHSFKQINREKKD